jgi:hypothetical protein
MASEHPQSTSAPPSLHYLGAFVISAIVAGLSFAIKDPISQWIVFGVAVAMILGIAAVALTPTSKSDED